MTSLETYLRELHDIRSTGAGVEEESYYHPLAALLNEVGKKLKPKVKCVLQLANRGAGKPDGGLFTADQFEHLSDAEPLPGQLPTRGAIEAKPAKDDAWVTAEAKQVTKYWNRYRQVLVTNYRDFVLVGQDAESNPAILETYRLAENEKGFWQAAATPRSTAEKQNDRFVEYLERVMRHGAPIAAPEDVAWFLASYARDALASIHDVELSALAAVRAALEEALGLKFEGDKGEHFFRSSLVQTLFYGIFSAWVLWSRHNPPTSRKRFDWRLTAWSLRVPMISRLFSLVADPQQLDALKLSEVLDWTGAVLNRADRASFFSNFQESHAVQYFYEPFLEAFDPELRKQLGVWYTPPEIVKYMVERVDTVLRQELGLPLGLADKNVYVLDPCCGTGSYLVEVLDRIHRTLKERGENGLTASDLKEAAQKRVFGFEILPAPFVVSHLQLGLLLQKLGVPPSDVAPASSRQSRQDGGATHGPERVGVYLTNALTGWEPPQGPKQHLIFPEMEQERDAAEYVKQQAKILVVLGNPPYNGFAGVAVAEERELTNAYRTTNRAPAPQGQGLNDLYVRFYRMAERRIVEMSGRGVVCFISNYSWLDGLSFTGMRERYLDAFDRVWIDCLNGDKYKTGKLTPEGEPDPSVFSTEFNPEGIQVGTAIALLVRSAGVSPAKEDKSQENACATEPFFSYDDVAIRSRGHLPHWEIEGGTYSVTFRLVDSLPQSILDSIEFERQDIVKTAKQQGRELTAVEERKLARLYSEHVEAALDAGSGACHLANPKVADVVAGALRYFDGQRYQLIAWSVMPNHVHVVFRPASGYSLEKILHSWKSFTSKQANKILGKSGEFWERESYDHLARDAQELERIVRYVLENPVKANLKNWNWVWCSAAFSPVGSAGVSPAGLASQPGPEDRKSQRDAGATPVRFRHLWGKTKRQQLLETAAQDGRSLYEQLRPPLELGLPFAPAQVDTGYLAWPLLPDLFPVSFPGVKTSRDDVVVDIDRERLIGRMKLYFDPRVGHEEMRRVSPSAMTSTARFHAEAVRDYLRKRGLVEKNVVRYCYRPFDVRWLYWEPETKLLDEKRTEYIPHVFEGNVWIEARQKQSMADFDRGYIVRVLADNFGNGLSNFFPLLLRKEQPQASLATQASDSEPQANLSDRTVRYLGCVGCNAPDVFYHSVATLHAPAYRRENADALRQNWPRIPLPDSKELLLASAALGRKIAALLDTEAPFDVAPASRRQEKKAIETVATEQEPPGWWRYIGVPTRVDGKALDETKDLAVTASWGHAGKGGVTMPGKGRLIERDYTPEELAGSAAVSAAEEEKSQQDAGATGGAGAVLLGDRTCDVYLNDVAYWKNIPLRVWEYTIGGYQVTKKWLSYREEKLLGRPMTKDEVRWVQEMARRIAAILLLEPALDENYRAVKAHPYEWPKNG
jgi:REP element-mobilizing transposase RayT